MVPLSSLTVSILTLVYVFVLTVPVQILYGSSQVVTYPLPIPYRIVHTVPVHVRLFCNTYIRVPSALNPSRAHESLYILIPIHSN
jgi:heme A synthase